MKNDTTATTATAGTIFIMRTKSVGQFSFGSSGNFVTFQEAYDAAIGFRSAHRRAERCSIWLHADGDAEMTELSPAGEAEPVKAAPAAKGEKAPKMDRKTRRERRKLDLIAIREQIRKAKFATLGVDAIVHDEPVVRRESFKEVQARVSAVKAVRILQFRGGRAPTIVVGKSVADFR